MCMCVYVYVYVCVGVSGELLFMSQLSGEGFSCLCTRAASMSDKAIFSPQVFHLKPHPRGTSTV